MPVVKIDATKHPDTPATSHPIIALSIIFVSHFFWVIKSWLRFGFPCILDMILSELINKSTLLEVMLVIEIAIGLLFLSKFNIFNFTWIFFPNETIESVLWDTNGALMHLNQADKTLTGAAKMHLDAGIKALQSGDTNGALMHLQQSQKSQWFDFEVKVKVSPVENLVLSFLFCSLIII